jgi:hypothetical protein
MQKRYVPYVKSPNAPKKYLFLCKSKESFRFYFSTRPSSSVFRAVCCVPFLLFLSLRGKRVIRASRISHLLIKHPNWIFGTLVHDKVVINTKFIHVKAPLIRNEVFLAFKMGPYYSIYDCGYGYYGPYRCGGYPFYNNYYSNRCVYRTCCNGCGNYVTYPSSCCCGYAATNPSCVRCTPSHPLQYELR